MDELFSRQMPHSLDAEQAVLGSILIDSRCAAQVISALKPEAFYTDLNRSIYEVICSMFNFARPIDAVTVLDEMKLQGVYDARTSQAYLVELMTVTPSTANVMRYVEIVRDKALLRGIAAVASEITASVVKVRAKGGDNGKLFGSVTSKEISEALKEQYGIELEKNRIILEENIKSFGSYEVKCKLGHEINGTIHLIVTEE